MVNAAVKAKTAKTAKAAASTKVESPTVKPLTAAQRATKLATLEKVIDTQLHGDLKNAVKLGDALETIRTNKLWDMAKYPTFVDYAQDRHEIKKSQVSNYTNAAKAFHSVTENAGVPDAELVKLAGEYRRETQWRVIYDILKHKSGGVDIARDTMEQAFIGGDTSVKGLIYYGPTDLYKTKDKTEKTEIEKLQIMVNSIKSIAAKIDSVKSQDEALAVANVATSLKAIADALLATPDESAPDNAADLTELVAV